MKRILILIIGLIGVAYGQSSPTSAKTRFVNGLYVGTKLDAYFAAADSNALYWRADSVVMAKYKGTARALAFASALGSYKLVADTFFTTGYTTRGGTKQVIDSLAKSTNFIYPEMYGAVGDLVTNDRVAIQNALNAAIAAKKTLVLKGSYFIDSTIQVNEGASIIGSGSATTGSIRITANFAAFNINGSNVFIRGITVVGSGRLGGYTYNNQHAIRVYGSADLLTSKRNVIISDCGFFDMAGAAIYITMNVGTSFFEGGVQISNSFATGSSIGFFTDVRGEYNSFTNCYAWANNIGWRNAGGNNRWVSGQLTGNTTGAYMEGGANNAHGKLIGAAINHNVDYAVWSSGVTLGMDIDNCNMYDNDIYIQNSVGIKFNGNDISVNAIYFENSSRLEFMNNKYVTTPTFDTTFNTTTSTYRFFNEYFWSTVPSIIKNTLPQKLVVNDSIIGTSIKRSGGTATQFLMADGSVKDSTYVTVNGVQSINAVKTFTDNPIISNTSTAQLRIKGNSTTGTDFQNDVSGTYIYNRDATPIYFGTNSALRVTIAGSEGNLTAANSLISSKLIGNSSTPSISGGSSSFIGSGASTSIVGNDMAGVATLITGTGCGSTGASNEAAFTVTFASAYAVAPTVIIQGIQRGGLNTTDGPTEVFFLRRDAVGTTAFTVYLPIGTTLTDSTTYSFTYHVIQ